MNGEKLKELREKYGYSREELAEDLYVTASIIQSWEEGWAIINPSSGEIGEMAELFHMAEESLREILDLSEDDDYDSPMKKLRFIDCVDSVINCVKKPTQKK